MIRIEEKVDKWEKDGDYGEGEGDYGAEMEGGEKRKTFLKEEKGDGSTFS